MKFNPGDIVEIDQKQYRAWAKRFRPLHILNDVVIVDAVVQVSDSKEWRAIVHDDDNHDAIPLEFLIVPKRTFDDIFEWQREKSRFSITLRLVWKCNGNVVSWRSGWEDREDKMREELVEIGKTLMESEREET